MDNYYNDSRIKNAMYDNLPEWLFIDINEEKMTAKLREVRYVVAESDEVETLHPVNLKYEVCPTCYGKGSHVNPSIDCNGLTYEDFDRDPEFMEEYFSGTYDVACYTCGGKRVVLNYDDSYFSDELKEYVQNEFRIMADNLAVEMAERAMGA